MQKKTAARPRKNKKIRLKLNRTNEVESKTMCKNIETKKSLSNEERNIGKQEWIYAVCTGACKESQADWTGCRIDIVFRHKCFLLDIYKILDEIIHIKNRLHQHLTVFP